MTRLLAPLTRHPRDRPARAPGALPPPSKEPRTTNATVGCEHAVTGGSATILDMPTGLPATGMTASEYLAWERVLANPRAIFEVLSRSTEAYDRGEKWAAYRRIPSLANYFLVSQSLPRIECFQRQGKGWHYEVVEAGGRLVLDEGFELDLDTLYDGVLALPGE